MLKVLDVTITKTLSASEHIREVIKSCAQTQYALRVLRAHGLSDSGLHIVFRSVAIAKIMYTCSAWSGFVNKHYEQRIDAFLDGEIRSEDSVSQTFRHSKNSVKLQTSSSLTKFCQTNNTFSATYFLHRLLPHSLTTCGEGDIVNSFLNTQDISWTQTS